MGNEIVALENEAYSVVSVNVPVSVLIVLCASAADDKIARRVVVESADEVQKCGFSTSRRSENGNEFLVSEGEVDTL